MKMKWDKDMKYVEDMQVNKRVWRDAHYKCPDCGEGNMYKYTALAFCTYPVQYMFCCNKCGYREDGPEDD